MTGRRRWAIVPLALALSWAIFPLSVRAATPTTLTLDTDAAITVGVHPAVEVRLSGPAGPIVGAQVEIQLDGRQTERIVTAADGSATAVLARDLDIGDYRIQAVFRGTPDHQAAVSAPTSVHVGSASLTVRTVPAVAGVPLLRVDGGALLSTGADGTIRIDVTAVRRYSFEVLIPPASPDRRLSFARWGDGSRETARSIRLPGRSDLVIGLEVAQPVTFSFIDAAGVAVDPARVETFLLANDRGQALEPGAMEPEWLAANRIVRAADGLTSVPIEYRIQEVGVRGANVVDRGRLHFQPDGQISTWVIPLLLYSLTIEAEDALFGTPVGTSARLEYPNGTVASVPLDERSSATISALPRGNYRAVVERPPGIGVSTPIVLSREQTVRMPVLSYLDVGFVIAMGLAIAGALVLFGGRPVGRLGRRVLGRIGALVLTALGLPLRLLRAVGRAVLVVVGLPLRLMRAVGRAVMVIVRLPGALVRRAIHAVPRRRASEPARGLAGAGGPALAFAGGMSEPTTLPVTAVPPPTPAAASQAVLSGPDVATTGAPPEVAIPAIGRPSRLVVAIHRSAPRDTDRAGRPIDQSRRHRHCPDCSNRLTRRARICRVCGRRVRRS